MGGDAVEDFREVGGGLGEVVAEVGVGLATEEDEEVEGVAFGLGVGWDGVVGGEVMAGAEGLDVAGLEVREAGGLLRGEAFTEKLDGA